MMSIYVRIISILPAYKRIEEILQWTGKCKVVTMEQSPKGATEILEDLTLLHGKEHTHYRRWMCRAGDDQHTCRQRDGFGVPWASTGT